MSNRHGAGDLVYRWLVPRVVFPLAERIGGRRLWSEARRLKTLQWRPQDELEARALERLQRLLTHAAAHVPHYQKLFRQAGMEPQDIRTLSDLEHFPLTTKAALRSGFPDRTTASNLPAHRRQKMRTSGSTGLPLEFFWDCASAEVLRGTALFLQEWAGVSAWDTRMLIASPSYFYTNIAPESPFRQLGRRIVLGERIVSLPANELTTEKFLALVHQVARRGRYLIRSYPSAIVPLASQLREEGIALSHFPTGVLTFAETLTAMDAVSIRETFHCAVINYYSSWEVPQMAQTCPDNPALLHVNTDRVILRVVRPDGTAASPGELGRVVVTDLMNYVMPFINYALDDQATVGPPCPCGRGFPTLSGIEGRGMEVIQTPAGVRINAGVLGQFLAFVLDIIPYVIEYQAVQEAPDAVRLRVVPTARFTTEFAGKLRDELAAFLGHGVSVSIDPVDQIAREPSGKRLIVKPHLAQR